MQIRLISVEARKMKSLWRLLKQRCTCCGQKLNPKQTPAERLAKINDKGRRLTRQLGRAPQIQSCRKCHRILFEGQTGFEQNYLLIDMGLAMRPKKPSAATIPDMPTVSSLQAR